jgi:uncharacterized protein YjbI with pentapeptide repeats
VPSRRRGLHKPSSDLIGNARDENAAQVTRIGLTFLGTTAFCLLSLLSPDSALLGGSEKISVPLAGPVSFFGFMLLGPAVLIALRIYLQMYVEHGDRLDRLARWVSAERALTLIPLQNPLIRLLSGLTFYLLLPVTILLFAWKAAVFSWGAGLFVVAAAVIASHVLLPFSKFSWRSRALVSAGIGAVACGVIFNLGTPRRAFDLVHANLSGQWLLGSDLRGANVIGANLSHANLRRANLSRASLSSADLSDAYLGGANLRDAYLGDANLSRANLFIADLYSADLGGADLREARLFSAHLSRADLSGANLSQADLSGRADLSHADLSNANLSGANLFSADLSDADLLSADLRDADLSYANLSRADLSRADLFSADLSDVDLSGANLRDVKNLTKAQLGQACGNSKTELPEDLKELTLKPCPGS